MKGTPMAYAITMPQLSDTMEEGRILKWLKEEGDEVEAGEIIAEIESDKADIEFEVYRTGVLHKILVPEGEVAPVGVAIAIAGIQGEDISELLAELAAAPKVAVAVEAPAPPAPPPPEVALEEEVKVEAKVAEEVVAPMPEVAPTDGRLKVSPVARRLAAEMGLDLATVQGTGPGGRIIKRDVDAAHLAPAAAPPPVAAPSPPPAEARPAEPFDEVPMTGMRKTIAQRLVESKAPVPHFYVISEVEMGQALDAKASLERLRGAKVTVTDLLVKACGLALVKHPEINSSYQGDVIRRYRAAHIGVVVSTEEGLVIPVVRETDEKTLTQIAVETADLAARGRQRKLRPEEYSGATFTISNLGMYGVDQFSAVIAPPQGAILAVGTIKERPVVHDGRVSVGQVMSLTLACDHRIIDGTAAAAFMDELKELLEHPVSLLI
ncbi:MAG: dihydrolipoamide acetyltransferase family protein [bacterium]|nr:dihydrolipoamide acetyltransferase family protein [bacterium]